MYLLNKYEKEILEIIPNTEFVTIDFVMKSVSMKKREIKYHLNHLVSLCCVFVANINGIMVYKAKQ